MTGGAQIRIRPETLQQAAQRAEAAATQLQQRVQQVQRDAVLKEWTGRAQEQHRRDLDAWGKAAAQGVQVLQKMAKNLRSTAQRLQEADMTAARRTGATTGAR